MLWSNWLRRHGLPVAGLIIAQLWLAPGSQAQSTWRPKTAPPSSSSPRPPSAPPPVFYEPRFYDFWYERAPIPEPPVESEPRAASLYGLDLAATLDSLLARLDTRGEGGGDRLFTYERRDPVTGETIVFQRGPYRPDVFDTESPPPRTDSFPAKDGEPVAPASQAPVSEPRSNWEHEFTGEMTIRRASLSRFNDAFLEQELNREDGRSHEPVHVLTGPSMAYSFSWDGMNFVTFGFSYLTLRSVDRQSALPGAAELDWQRVTTTTIPFDVGYARHGDVGAGAWVAGAAFSIARVTVDVEYRNPLDRRYDYEFEFSGFGMGAALHAGYRQPVWGVLSLSVGGRYDLVGPAKLGIDGLEWLWATPGGGLERAAVDLSGPSLTFGIQLGG